jgi:uncharacterized NAD(P)/FAD-binding protein YdhS
MQSHPRTIVIVGGGFSGTVLAVNLLRQITDAPTLIVLVERAAEVGCGVAFAPHPFPYLLNVPAGRMSATSDDTAQLINFAQRQMPDVHEESYLPRRLYGEYLQDELRKAELAAPAHIRLRRVHGEATCVRPIPHSTSLLVSVGARQLLADQVVLACGTPAPADKPYAADISAHPAYVHDPHRDEGVRASDQCILLIGTGLTMVDVALAAVARNPAVRIIALSRHGLLPTVQRTPVASVLDAKLDLRAYRGASLRRLVAAVRSLATAAQERGGDCREVITRVREAAPELWQSLADTERRRFLRHVRAYWDVHRHRMPPVIAEQVNELRRSGQLQVRAGSVRQLCAQADGVVALWQARGRFDTQELWVDRIIECSGLDHRLERTADPLLRYLLDAGLAWPDAAGLGLRTGKHGALVGADGRASTRLFYLGPMLRADHWEATAVSELRQHAERLALALAQQVEHARELRTSIVTALRDHRRAHHSIREYEISECRVNLLFTPFTVL